MSATIRDFTNFEDFPGEIDEEQNMYVFPRLYKRAATGKVREWQMYVRLIKEASKNAKVTRDPNWNLFAETEVPIKQEYLVNGAKLPLGILCEYYTETGFIGMKITRSAAVYTVSKNIGKANERNALQSALIECRAKYLKRVEEGASIDQPTLVSETAKLSINTTKRGATKQPCDALYFPMLAKNYKDFVKKVSYPVQIQPKLDGLRCVAYLRFASGKPKDAKPENVVLYSRQKKEFPSSKSNDNIRKCLLPLLQECYDEYNNCSIFLDGEFYIHGETLQEINSVTRGVKADKLCQYWIFDCFYPSQLDKTFNERYKFLQGVYNEELTKEQQKYVCLVPTHDVKTEAENTKIYKKYLSQGYEGIIIRNPNGVYAAAKGKNSATRSSDLLKRKEVFDQEFEIVGYTDGKNGKEVGAIIWICNAPGGEFNVVPNLPYDDRYKLYVEASKGDGFVKKFKNRMITVEFRSWSDDDIPLQAKALEFRDYK